MQRKARSAKIQYDPMILRKDKEARGSPKPEECEWGEGRHDRAERSRWNGKRGITLSWSWPRPPQRGAKVPPSRGRRAYFFNIFLVKLRVYLDFPGDSDNKESPCKVGDLGSIPGLGRSPGGGHATYSSILTWRSNGQRKLESYNPWGHKESKSQNH